MPSTCPQCSTASVKHVIPVYLCARYPCKPLMKQTTENPPDTVGVYFAADVNDANKPSQYCAILQLLTVASMLPDEKSTTLRKNLARLCLTLRPLNGPIATVRVDPAPYFAALKNDTSLQPLDISVDVVRIKNVN